MLQGSINNGVALPCIAGSKQQLGVSGSQNAVVDELLNAALCVFGTEKYDFLKRIYHFLIQIGVIRGLRVRVPDIIGDKQAEADIRL
ncbi:hypothetical protein SDC9_169603 [bioreactor metagenome]|uniref:Uncharacterized protein n=1 Tax=bioreactor metagenome TaxID=1076179 RepID=A0A645G8A2_9ZZZZ